ncbi:MULTISPECIES: carbohydrate ABC transporter permease [Ruminococcus]|uniref:Binding-protein-dependent transport systems inner membrane component n=1 Tax=Ruminococcus albus (strain ATCC 27210 / DSM 20455 / JCM 14654 / NCDO 2250 / 7) TaxID=697329 RepID=E6UFC9_RUMA7|nr:MULTISPECIES: sugar ABC transporter permease [Ruminococcus]ADU21015.1 binding-protein-dependent transport systems inner membrane component [Ruminococcus albus 7 = DSM 20455]MCR5021666.1 sugar ABC transporter permease [Ruminococcus sp.]
MKHKSISYAKWGYIFVIPFFAVFIVFNLFPLLSTFNNSLYEYYKSNGVTFGPKWIGLQNYTKLFSAEVNVGKYFMNTFIIWLMGFIPQIFFSLLFASWFTDLRMKLKTGAYKIIFYLPNVIMAAAMGMLFFTMFDQSGPMTMLLKPFTGGVAYKFFENVWSQRTIIALINFMMWYGNTTIMLMAAINGVDPSLYESAQIDGANPSQTFWNITIPLIRPILVYVLITSLIGGLQMYDVPQIITKNGDAVNRTSMTMIMYLQYQMNIGKNYGYAGAISVVLFVVAAALSMLVFYINSDKDEKKRKKGVK